MILDPHTYGMLKRDDGSNADMMRERHIRMMSRMVDGDADREYVRVHVSRLVGWLGGQLVRLSERIQPEVPEAPQGHGQVREVGHL